MSNLTELTKLRSTPGEKQLWVETAKGEKMNLSEWLRSIANERASDTTLPRPVGRPRKDGRRHGAQGDPATGEATSGPVETPPLEDSGAAGRVAGTGESPGGAAPTAPAAPRPMEQEYPATAEEALAVIDTSDFVPRTPDPDCNHEPYKSAKGSFCYRCGSRI